MMTPSEAMLGKATLSKGEAVLGKGEAMLGKNEAVLDKRQKTSLHVLGYLFLRMGLWDKAERTFTALVALSKDSPCSLSYAALAAIALEKKDGKKAVQFLHIAMQDLAISSRNAGFHLMRAKALWLEERHDEAKLALNEYLYIAESASKV